MKDIFKIMTLSVLFWAGSANAELAWTQNAFWQAPYEKNQVLLIEAMDPKLPAICKEYQETVQSGGLDKEQISVLRTETDNISESQFTTKFRIRLAESQALVQKSVERANGVLADEVDKNPLPSFSLATAEIVENLNLESEIQVGASGHSLTNVSKAFGLKPLKISVVGVGYSATIRVTGKDTACDLQSGLGWLEFASTAQIRIGLEDQRRLDDIYRVIEEFTADVYSKKQSVIGRASLLGFKIGGYLIESEKISPERAVTYVGNIVERFFDLSLLPNHTWSTFEGRKHLVVPGTSAPTPVKITLRGKI